MSRLNVRLVGVKECLDQLTHIPEAIQRRHMRIATNAAGGILKRDAVARVPTRTKLLRQALAVKVTQNRKGEWFVVVGAKRGMKRAVKVAGNGRVRALSKRATANLKFTPGGAKREYIDPARYSHLAESGSKAHYVTASNKRVLASNGQIFGRRVVIAAKGSKFLAATALASGPAATQKAVDKLREAILAHAK